MTATENDWRVHLAHFTGTRADPVLAFVDADGYPVNLRCSASVPARGPVDISPPADAGDLPRDGQPCALLWHLHDDALVTLASIVAKGTVHRDGDQLHVELVKPPFLSGVGDVDYTAAMASFSLNSREYLRDHDLQEPDIHWEVLEQLAKDCIARHGDGGRDPV